MSLCGDMRWRRAETRTKGCHAFFSFPSFSNGSIFCLFVCRYLLLPPFFSLLLSLPKLQTLADASNYAGPLCQALRRGASLDEEERKHARKGILRASAAGSSSDCLQLLPAIDEKEQQQASNTTEEPAAENDDSAESEEEEDSLRDRLVARQLEVVDALCRALREALEGMERATAAAARLADDGAALARDAVAAPSSSSSASAAASAAALSSGGASPCAASTASSLADAARAMAATSACARAAAGAVEAGANVGGLRALLRTLRGERRRREESFPLHFSGFFLQIFSFLLTKADKRHHQPPQKNTRSRLALPRRGPLRRRRGRRARDGAARLLRKWRRKDESFLSSLPA